ncbi:hypothetical protein SAMN05421878_11347 [Actinobaculum suis]|uniref:Lipoprotein n=1 Tax=Actinobaculum suis TaxID=1657 RepID=A0A1G7DXG4_9ACTO|nr:hypothetical protein [Actinobaculum suis]MDY5152898.1 hypothetical protein [Actinobaculum suis]SDE55826.1 hypothetical protein SAMN05421878_11347 [Actinobaculum suis]
MRRGVEFGDGQAWYFAVIAISAILVFATGCMRQESVDSEALYSYVEDTRECAGFLKVESELGVRGPIVGFDCFDESGRLLYVFRQTDDAIALSESGIQWALDDDKKVLFHSDGWYLLTTERLSGELSNAFPALGDARKLKPFGESFDKAAIDGSEMDCLADVAGMVFDYAYYEAPMDVGITDEVKRALEKSYPKEIREVLQKEYGEADSLLFTELGNRASELNCICKDGRGLYE